MAPKRRIALLCSCWLLLVGAAQAQQITVDFRDVALREALEVFSTQERVTFIFSERQVRDLRSTCAYQGTVVGDAIACILQGTTLRAERVRRRQYVLSSISPAAHVVPLGMIRGFVTDATSGEMLSGANIYLASMRLGTITNSAGYFALSHLPPVDYTVRISYVGYAAVDTVMAAYAAPLSHIRLQRITIVEQAQEVVAPLYEPLAVEPGVLRVPTGILQRMPGFPGEADLLNALRWLPGVQRAGTSTSGLVVRGSAPDQNLYLLDGAPVYHPWHAFSLVSTFQSEKFKDVRLYRGSFPAEHGGRLSAVLDAEMKDGNREEATAAVAVGAFSGRFILETPLGDHSSAMFSVRRSYIDGVIGKTQPVSDGSVVDTMRTGYYFMDMSGKITWRPSNRQRLSLSVYGGRDVLDLRLPFDITLDFTSSLRFRDWLRPSELFFEVDTHWGNYLVNARYQYLHSNQLFVTAALYSSSYVARESIYIQPVVSSSVMSRYHVNLHDAGLKLDVDYYPLLTHQVRTGLRVVRRIFNSKLDAEIRRTPGSVDNTNQESRLSAVELVGYIQDTWKPMASLQVQLGLRGSILSGGTRLVLDPRLGLRFDGGTFVLRASGGAQVQYVHRIRDRYSFLYDLVSARWVPASGSLDPSRSINMSVGVAAPFTQAITWSLDAYWHTSNGILLPTDEARDKDGLEGPGIELGTLLGQYSRGRARAYGLESMTRVRLGPWLSWISYAAGRSFSRTPELSDKSYRPARYDVPQIFQAAIMRDVGRFTFSISSVWRSGYPTTVPIARYAVGDPLSETPTRYLHRPRINNGRLPVFFRLGFQAGYWFTVRTARISAQVQAYNLTNRRNVVGREYYPEGDGPVLVEDRHGFPLIPLFEIKAEL